MSYALLKLIFGKTVKFSYAFTGEDRIIESLLKKSIRTEGFYVEVGCNHPTFISNTFSLYKKGWRGICIDANKRLIRKYSYLRPRDTAIVAAISDKIEKVEFTEYTNDGLSSIHSKVEQEHTKSGQKIIRRTMMQTKRLTNVLEALNAPTSFDLLSIDAEENDFEVLKSLDLNQYTPRLVVLELDEFDLADPSSNLVYQYLDQYNYKFVGYILTNAYFMLNKEN